MQGSQKLLSLLIKIVKDFIMRKSNGICRGFKFNKLIGSTRLPRKAAHLVGEYRSELPGRGNSKRT